MISSVDNALSQRTEQEVVAVLVHMAKLLRTRNWLCSPLLRLPTEVIIHILSFVMTGLAPSSHCHPWKPVQLICHRIRRIMCDAVELWWGIDCRYTRTAHFILARSEWDPQLIFTDLRCMEEERLAVIEKTLNYWRDKQRFKGHRLQTFKFYGSQFNIDNFSWIFERPLLRLESLTIKIIDAIEEDEISILLYPVTLELPVDADMPLKVLDLRNVTIPWSSHPHLFSRLRELRLSFRDCFEIVTIPEDELFGVLGASPQLEHLSLLQVGHEVPVRDGRLLPPKRTLKLTNLASLCLDNDPMVVKYVLSYMDLPVIHSLEIRSLISSDLAHTPIDLFFPDDRLSSRLFPNPRTLAIKTVGRGRDASIEIEIGGVGLRLDFPLGEGERGRNIVMSCIPNLVPPSVTALKLEYTTLEERGWRDFFMSHPQVRSIECTEFSRMPISREFWKGLSPAGEGGAGVPCPELESISIVVSYCRKIAFTPISNCLRDRQAVGFKLRNLKLMGSYGSLADMEGFHEEFTPLVEVAEAKTDGYRTLVRPFLTLLLGVC